MSSEVTLVEEITERKLASESLPVAVATSNQCSEFSSMTFSLKTSALDVHIESTIPTNVQIIQLQAQLAFAMSKLEETERRLDEAMRLIGMQQVKLQVKSES